MDGLWTGYGRENGGQELKDISLEIYEKFKTAFNFYVELGAGRLDKKICHFQDKKICHFQEKKLALRKMAGRLAIFHELLLLLGRRSLYIIEPPSGK